MQGIISKNDLLILSCLRRNARETLTKMSKITSIPISTIYDRLKYHEKDLIKKHTSLIDFPNLGFNTIANINIKVKKEDKEPVKEFLIKHQNVNNVYKINNGYDFSIEVIFRHLKELEEFSEMMEDKFRIKQKVTYYVIETVKREAFLSDYNTLEVV